VRTRPRIYADLSKIDINGNVILSCVGTRRDLENMNLVLAEGMQLTLYMDSDVDEFGSPDNLLVDGFVKFDKDNDRWLAQIDRDTYRHDSDERNNENE